MKVFKFGGASIKDAKAVQNMASIVKSFAGSELVIVVSAMGKTTNAIERILNAYYKRENHLSLVDDLKRYHHEIIHGLFDDTTEITKEVDELFSMLTSQLKMEPQRDQTYDQTVSMGELISSTIVAAFLRKNGIVVDLVDARKNIVTDSTFREGKVDWATSEKQIQKTWSERSASVILTQGFIGGTPEGFTTTLGREGSDFTAAIFGSCLNAESVTIWKDVPGVMTADPKRIEGAAIFTELPYKEAAEMTYYGASVIHPKTIKPLALKKIPLLVKSFDDPTLAGTVISDSEVRKLQPLVVFKENQCLVSCKVTDYSFVNEAQLTQVFSALSELNIKINVMQNSAISFSFCIDFREDKVEKLVERLKDHFEVYYNTGLTLITVKNYDKDTFEEYRKKDGVILEQSSRSTLQVLIKPAQSR